MRPEASKRSTLHLQMGQETVYLVLTMAVFATVVLSAMLYKTRQPFEDPPIITLAEADGFYFAPGSPAISQDFDRQLRATVVPRLRTIADKYGAYTVEVIGNTDEVPLGPSLRRGSNLDGGGLFPPGRRSRGPDGSSSGNCGRLSSALPALDYCVARSQRRLSQPQPCRP